MFVAFVAYIFFNKILLTSRRKTFKIPRILIQIANVKLWKDCFLKKRCNLFSNYINDAKMKNFFLNKCNKYQFTYYEHKFIIYQK